MRQVAAFVVVDPPGLAAGGASSVQHQHAPIDEITCSSTNMPRLVASGTLTAQQIKDLVGLLLDPMSPVNE